MDYTIERGGADVVVRMRGRFTFADNASFIWILGEMRGDGARHWAFDLSAVEFIDSSAMGMLLMANDAAKTGGGLTVRGAHGQVRRTLELARFDQIVRLEPT